LEFRKESITDKSDTDVIMSRYTIGVRGIITKTPGTGRFAIASDGVGVDAATTYKAIENTLNKRRRRFVYQDVATKELLICEPALSKRGDMNAGKAAKPTLDTDVNNGPWCQEFIIDSFRNSTYHISARFVLHKRPCRKVSGTDANILSNRWEVEETRDVNTYLTRRIVGHVRFASVNGEKGTFARLCYPFLPDGFRRENIRTAVSANGLELAYTFVDKQVAAAAPYPATDWDASVREELTNEMKMMTAVNIKLTGPPNVDKQQLIQAGMAFVLRRVAVGRSNQRFIGLSVLDHVSGSDVQVSANVLHHASLEDATTGPSAFTVALAKLSVNIGLVDPKTVATLKSDRQQASKATKARLKQFLGQRIRVSGRAAGSFNEFGPAYDSQKSSIPAPYGRGTAAELFVSWLQDPCGSIGDLPNGFALRRGPEGRAKGPPKNYSVQAGDVPDTLAPTGGRQPQVKRLILQAATFKLPKAGPQLSQLAVETYYDFGQVESHIITNTYAVQLPICASSSGSPDSVVVDLARNATRWVVRARMTRSGQWPQLLRHEPLKDKTMKTLTPIGEAKVCAQAPVMRSDGVLTFTIDSEYMWAAERSPRPGEDLRAPSLPWITTTPAGNRIPGGLQAVPGSKGAIA